MKTVRQGTSEARDICKAALGDSTNFLTPAIVGYALTRFYAIELSAGESIMDRNKRVYGVTVVSRDGKTKVHELSKLCHSRAEADIYIKGFK